MNMKNLSWTLWYLSALPSAPGVPQAVDVDSTEVTIVWLRPDRDGDLGQVEGYQIQYHKTEDPQWHPAHAGLIQDTQCTSKGSFHMKSTCFSIIIQLINHTEVS